MAKYFPDSTAKGKATLKAVTLTPATTGAVNEVWVETVTATGGTRTLTFDGQTTSAIAYNANAATIQTALEALSNVAPGDIVVTGTGPYTYTFSGEYAGENTPSLSVDGSALTKTYSSIATTVPGVAAVNEVQTETVTATGGTRTLTFSGQTTSALAFDADAATIQTALEALSNVAPGDITVAGTGPYTYTFGGAYAGTNAAAITVNTGSLTGGSSSFETTTPGVAPVNEVQVETITATGGSRTLTYSGQTTVSLAYNAAAATIQTALEALSNLAPGDVTVTGTGPYTYTFGGTLAGTNVSAMTVDGALLTGVASVMEKTNDGGLSTGTAAAITAAIKRNYTVDALKARGLAKVGGVQNDLEKALAPKPADIGDPNRYNADGSPKYR